MKVIAEVGSNWKNSAGQSWREDDDLFRAVEYAKEDGADAVKFQHFTSMELYGENVPAIDEYSVGIRRLEALKKHADEVGIEFMCSAFSLKGYGEINLLVKTHKIASSECNWFELVKYVLTFEKDTIISVGGLSRSGVKRNVIEWSLVENPGDLTLLYCDPTYPSLKTPGDVVEGIKALEKYGVDVGLSDHTNDIYHPDSIKRRISVIEKHYNPLEYTSTPDAGHSLSRREFKQFALSCKSTVSHHTVNPHMRKPMNGGMFRPRFK